jgi:hypothetical protein
MRADDGETPLSPQNFVARTLSATWDNLPQIVIGAIWLNLCLLPALLLGLIELPLAAIVAGVLLGAPGWVALQRFEFKLAQGKVVPLRTLPESFRLFWTDAVRLGMLAIFLPVATGGLAGWSGTATWLGPLLLLGVAFSIVAGSLLLLYAVPLLVVYGGELPGVLRNTAILSARHINNTVGMVALAVLCVLAVAYVSSGLAFVLPALYGMFIANNCRLVVELEDAG